MTPGICPIILYQRTGNAARRDRTDTMDKPTKIEATMTRSRIEATAAFHERLAELFVEYGRPEDAPKALEAAARLRKRL